MSMEKVAAKKAWLPFASFGWPEGAYALRLIVAAFGAFLAAQALGFEHGYGAVFSAIIVTRPYSQGALKAGALRLLATAGGIAMAFAAVWLKRTGLNEYELLLLTLVPLSLAAAYDQSYRTSLISALIMLSAPLAKTPEIDVAVARALVVGLGAVIGIAVSVIVLPQKHEAVTGRKAAKALQSMMQQLRNGLELAPDLRQAEKADRQVRKMLLEIGQVSRDHATGKREDHESARIIGLTRHVQSLCVLLRSHWRRDMSDADRAARQDLCGRLQVLAAFTGDAGEVKSVIGAIRTLPPLPESDVPEAWLLESVARNLAGLRTLIAD